MSGKAFVLVRSHAQAACEKTFYHGDTRTRIKNEYHSPSDLHVEGKDSRHCGHGGC